MKRLALAAPGFPLFLLWQTWKHHAQSTGFSARAPRARKNMCKRCAVQEAARGNAFIRGLRGTAASRQQLTDMVAHAKKVGAFIVFDAAYAPFIRNPGK